MNMYTVTFFNVVHLSEGRGGEVWTREVISYLNSTAKFKARLITTDCCFQNPIKTDFEYKIIKYKKFLGLSLYAESQLLPYLEESDLVYNFNAFLGSQFPLIKDKNLHNKLIFGYHAYIDTFIQKLFYSFIYTRIKNIGYHHVLTHYYYEILKRKGLKRIFIVPNFVDTEKFKRSKDKDIYFIAPGAVIKEKGLDLILELAKQTNEDIIVTGRKPNIKDYPPNLKFTGYLDRENYIELISRSKICLMPTRKEQFPITFLECLASGNLILARNLPVLREVSGAINSVVFFSNNDDFIQKFKMIKSMLGSFEMYSEESIRRAKEFDKNKVLNNFTNILLHIIENNSV
ncbi:glycosyltransferase family 4 protein [Metallosphaera sp. D4-4]|uniref:glycosyltransferase family 4 protein n=1 Tax=Metallosphaera sp. D4-4 TaxID=3379815 RepID=UPI00390891F5